jgi:2,4-dienoyl-CoA reductase-like NADH-dependent reductase (Old Yellow Enzyme family)
MALLFEPVTQRGVTFRNRTVVAPMCQYSARDGLANDWHLVHLGRFALGGFGMVMVEATGVTPEGRISWADVGLWNDAQVEALRPVTRFLRSQKTVSAIQLAHAGRKASTPVDWRRDLPAASESEQREAGFEHWQPVAPSAVVHAADSPDFQQPHALTCEEIAGVVRAFADAARRADAAGFDMVEVHAAHGYLINQFLSPIANKRDDDYGGNRENRMRLVLEVTEAVRAALPQDKPVWVRISASDNAPGGWDVEDSVALARELKALGVDAIDCSSGGFAEGAHRAEPRLPGAVRPCDQDRRRHRHRRGRPAARRAAGRSHRRAGRGRLHRPGARGAGRPQLAGACAPPARRRGRRFRLVAGAGGRPHARPRASAGKGGLSGWRSGRQSVTRLARQRMSDTGWVADWRLLIIDYQIADGCSSPAQ